MSAATNSTDVAVELVSRIGPVARPIHGAPGEPEAADAVANHAAVETLEGLESLRWMLLAHTRRAHTGSGG